MNWTDFDVSVELDAHARDSQALQDLSALPFHTPIATRFTAVPEEIPEVAVAFEQDFHTLSGTGQSQPDEIVLPKGGRRLSLTRPMKPRQVSACSLKVRYCLLSGLYL